MEDLILIDSEIKELILEKLEEIITSIDKIESKFKLNEDNKERI